MNRVAYPSYEKAIKHLNLKFNSLAESFDAGHNINVFENDNLLCENGLAGGFANHPKGGGFSGEGNLEGNTPLNVDEEREEEKEVVEEIELSDVEKAVDKMNEGPEVVVQSDDEDADLSGKPWEDEESKEEDLKENHKLKIARALENMDAIIDSLTEGKVKKKVYTIK